MRLRHTSLFGLSWLVVASHVASAQDSPPSGSPPLDATAGTEVRSPTPADTPPTQVALPPAPPPAQAVPAPAAPPPSVAPEGNFLRAGMKELRISGALTSTSQQGDTVSLLVLSSALGYMPTRNLQAGFKAAVSITSASSSESLGSTTSSTMTGYVFCSLLHSTSGAVVPYVGVQAGLGASRYEFGSYRAAIGIRDYGLFGGLKLMIAPGAALSLEPAYSFTTYKIATEEQDYRTFLVNVGLSTFF